MSDTPYTLIGKDFTPPDVVAKVTGKARYAEDFRRDGMVFCRLLLSDVPHGRVTRIDAEEALKMPGVIGVLTADDVPAMQAPLDTILTNEPLYVGDPILAVAAETEEQAQNALERIVVDIEALPFVVDPLNSLYPGGPNARSDGNVAGILNYTEPFLKEVKWSARDFIGGEKELPMGEALEDWSVGDVESAFAGSAYVLEETFVTAGIAHHSMEPRSCFAYWENGKCHVHGSSQSQSYPVPGLARYIGIDPADLVFVAEFCGGGFGSKGSAYPSMSIPAHMSRKVGRPVMMRISRQEEYCIGFGRCGFQGRIKMGFRADGRLLGVDLYVVHENGPYAGFSDYHAAGEAVSLVYQPEAMRFRGIPVSTNTPPRRAQRGPGQNQMACVVEPLLDKAANALSVDRIAIRTLNAPPNPAQFGAKRKSVTSSFMEEAIAQGKREFDWDAKVRSSGARRGSKVIGVGVGQAYHSAGAHGFDGLVVITPDGKLHIHTGVGNLGTYSYGATARVAAEVLGYDWDNCVIERGDSRRHLPWNLGQFGSNTSFTMSRTNYVAAMDALEKIRMIAAAVLGGDPDDYDIGNETVFSRSDSARRMTYAEVAQEARQRGGVFSGEQLPDDINEMTRRSAEALAGSGLVGVARDNLGLEGTPPAFAVGFMQIELDTETGTYDILDYVAVADCGRVLHPMGLATQIKSGAVMGIGMATLERHVYDPQNGLPANVGLVNAKPPTYLDVPSTMRVSAVDRPDPANPVGSRGVGEPVQGCASAALLCAISDAMGGHYFNRTPVVPDMIINAARGRAQSYKPLQVNTF